MSGSKRDYRLDALLDSLSGDAELERKMNAFSHAREEEEDTEKTGPVLTVHDNREPEEPDGEPVFEAGDTMVHQPGQPAASEPANDGGTVVFAPDEIEDTARNEDSTVVLDNDEIDSLIEEEKGPTLRRERVEKPGRTREKKSTDWKAAGIVAGVIGVVALGGLLIFGISRVASSFTSEKTEEKATDAEFARLQDWAQGLTSSQNTGISDYEIDWNKLNDSQKRDINEILRQKTGKSFDEILAEEKAGEKADKDNNNTAVAEQKARLKDQIAQLQSQLASAQQDYDSAQSKIDSAQSQVDSASSALADAQNSYGSAQQSVYDLQSQVDALSGQIQELQNTDLSELDKEEAADVQKQLQSLLSQQSSLQSQLNDANATLNQAAGVISARQNDLASAQGALNALAGSTDSAQSRINDLNAQIAQLQSQLDALN